MANSYFDFKQFSIQQDKCAQKVSEIACIQGAYTSLPLTSKKVLDIGSGTGLLSLMIAQRYDVEIDALEIDEETYTQGEKNIRSSTFSHKIKCLLGDINTFLFEEKYDFIITNPPFFERQLISENEKANLAKHSSQLTLSDLLKKIDSMLIWQGQFSILLPYNRKEELEMISRKYNFYPHQYLFIKHSESHEIKNMVVLFSREKGEAKIETLIVKEENTYSLKMMELMQVYYLAL